MPEWLLTVIVGGLAASGAWIASRWGRIATLERRVADAERVNQRMWLIIREQHDFAYRHGFIPKSLPDDLFGKEE